MSQLVVAPPPARGAHPTLLLTAATVCSTSPSSPAAARCSGSIQHGGNRPRIYRGQRAYVLGPEYIHESSDHVHDSPFVQARGDGVELPSYTRAVRDARQPWASSFSGSRRSRCPELWARLRTGRRIERFVPRRRRHSSAWARTSLVPGQNIDVSGTFRQRSAAASPRNRSCATAIRAPVDAAPRQHANAVRRAQRLARSARQRSEGSHLGTPQARLGLGAELLPRPTGGMSPGHARRLSLPRVPERLW